MYFSISLQDMENTVEKDKNLPGKKWKESWNKWSQIKEKSKIKYNYDHKNDLHKTGWFLVTVPSLHINSKPLSEYVKYPQV